MKLRIEPLRKNHDRETFSCGNPELDDWFKRQAGQDSKRNVARVFVATAPDLGVVGFYSLSAFTLSIEDLPEGIARKLPRYDKIPAALIGRLATDLRARGQGVGKLLLADAIKRILGASEKLAVYAIVVDAKDENASDFYQVFGFKPFPLNPKRLFLPTKTAIDALTKAE